MQQAARVSDKTAFLLMEKSGEPATLIEYDDTNKIFTNPKDKRTENYINRQVRIIVCLPKNETRQFKN